MYLYLYLRYISKVSSPTLMFLILILQLIIYEMTNSLDALAQGNEDDYDDDEENDDDDDTTDTEDLEDGSGDING